MTLNRGRYYHNLVPRSQMVWNECNPNNPWKKGMVVHHTDGNTLNDDIGNLKLMTKGEHSRLHQTGNKHCLGKVPWNKGLEHSKETRQKIADKAKTRLEVKENNPMFNRKHSEETRKKISEGMKGRLGTKGMLGKHHTEETKKKMSMAHKKGRMEEI